MEQGNGGGGGGGVIWIATHTYDGALTAVVSPGAAGGCGASAGSPGTAQIFQLYADGHLVQRLFSDTWTSQ